MKKKIMIGLMAGMLAVFLSTGWCAGNYSQVGFDLMKNETIGSLRIGASDVDVLKIMGSAQTKSKATVWGADGLEHQKWNYPAKGIELGMVRDGVLQNVDRITIKSPCGWKTKRAIGIGATEQEVRNAYKDEINPNAKGLVAGTIYGGIIFSLNDGLVSSIFIGAAAE